MIDDQIKDTKELIEREQEAFKAREIKHEERYGTRQERQTVMTTAPRSTTAEARRDSKTSDIHPHPAGEDTEPPSVAEADHLNHDDSHEVVVETNEDTVIY